METFTKEISVMSKLHHPRIVLLMGACINDPQNLMIVMELMEGGSVWSHLRKKNPPPLRQRMNWAYETCLGMSYLHRPDNKILHLDLKTANLLLDSSLSVKVADFGLSEVKKLQVFFLLSCFVLSRFLLFLIFYSSFLLLFFSFYHSRQFLSQSVKGIRSKTAMGLCLSRYNYRLSPSLFPKFLFFNDLFCRVLFLGWLLSVLDRKSTQKKLMFTALG